MMVDEQEAATRPSFAAWLVKREAKGDWVDGLVEAARADRTFPRVGDIESVRKWLQGKRPSGDDWEALEDAELDYLAF